MQVSIVFVHEYSVQLGFHKGQEVLDVKTKTTLTAKIVIISICRTGPLSTPIKPYAVKINGR
jgi:hypothetical protein